MYSPKIDEQLIPDLYRAARARRIPMTKLITRWLREALAEEQTGQTGSYAIHAHPPAGLPAMARERSGTDQEYKTEAKKQTKGVMQ